MACPKAAAEHTKVVHFEHGPPLAPEENLLSVASSNSAFDTTKIFEQWIHAVDLYFELNLKGTAKKHRQLLREFRLLVPPEQPENSLTPKLQKLIAFLWFNIGQIKTLEGQDSIACEAYNLSVKIDGKFALAWYGLGISLFKLDSFKKSEKAFATCLDIFDEMDTKSIDVDLRVSLGNGAKIDSEMEGGNATINAPEENGASIAMLEKNSPVGRIKKFVFDRVPAQHNKQLSELHKAWRATKVAVTPGNKDKLNVLPTNVMYTPAKLKTIVNCTPYDAFFNPPKEEEADEEELDTPIRGYHDALTEIASSSKEKLDALSVKEQETAPTVNEKDTSPPKKGKKKKSSKRKAKAKTADTNGKEKVDDTKGKEEIVDIKAVDNKVDVKGKGKMVDLMASDTKADVKGKGKMNDLKPSSDKKVDVKGKAKMVETKLDDKKVDVKKKDKPTVFKPYFSKRPEPKPRAAAEIELWNFANAHKEQQVVPLWLTKHRAIEEHFDDYHCLLPARDIVLDDFYRHAKNAIINDIYLNTPKFDKEVPPLEDSLKGVDEYYRKAFKDNPDLEGEEEWYCSISEMFFGKKQNLDKAAEVEKLSVEDSDIPGNITTEEYKQEMRNFLGIDTPSFADKELPDLPIAAKLALHNKERKELAHSIRDMLKAKADAEEPPIDYKVFIKVHRSSVVYVANKSTESLATATSNAPTGSTAPSTNFGSTFTGTGTVLHTPATPATGIIDGGPAIVLTPAGNEPFPRYSEPEFEIGLPGMRTTLPHHEGRDTEVEEKTEVRMMPDGITPMQRGTGDGMVTEGMGPGEMLYPTVFEGF
ncbi:hypothetical protein MMC18_000589 [Xylographa bjoerkii]|nr:hypothetical protein [Xylographa bjoerkii]